MTETDIQNTIMLELSKSGAIAFRNNVGAAKTESGGFVKFGVGGTGGSDLICIVPVEITPDMVGKTLGIFTAIEVKTKKGRPTTNQNNFINAIKNNGGLAGIARSVDDALKIINDI